MRSGRLRETLVFQIKNSTTRDSFGGVPESWTDDFEIDGGFQPLGSEEFHTSWKRYSETTARFLIRAQDGIDCALHRIKMIRDYVSPAEVSYWDIQPPIPVQGRPFEMHIEANEIRG